MKANPDKCYLLPPPAQVLIDSELGFDEHISLIFTNVSRKINALGRIANFMSYGKRHLIMKAFIESQFN